MLQVHELYERVSEVLLLAGDAVPLRSGMSVERQLAIAADGSTLEPGEIAAVASALEGLFELREFFCGAAADAKVGRESTSRVGWILRDEREGEGRRGGRDEACWDCCCWVACRGSRFGGRSIRDGRSRFEPIIRRPNWQSFLDTSVLPSKRTVAVIPHRLSLLFPQPTAPPPVRTMPFPALPHVVLACHSVFRPTRHGALWTPHELSRLR